ncbi:MAG TPA: hypothetical protein VGL77_07820 [Armatimonadota bacterium]|jgi:hypothetical protein
MQTVWYILASIAALFLIIAIPVLTVRALILMARVETTRHDLSELISEAGLSLQHVNRLLARTQEGVDRLRHTLDRLERILAVLQPAVAVGGVLAGAKRFIAGHQAPTETSRQSACEGESS